MNIGVLAKHLLPVDVSDKILDWMGANKSMSEFKGRNFQK